MSEMEITLNILPSLDENTHRSPSPLPIEDPFSQFENEGKDNIEELELTSTTPSNPNTRIGESSDGKTMPGFQEVMDEYHLFNSESDFTIFNNQITSEIPLQRLVAVRRLADHCKQFGKDASVSVIPRIRAIAKDKEMVIRQQTAEQLGFFAKYLVEECNDGIESHNVLIECVLPLVKEMLVDAMEVRQAAGRSLVQMAELLTKDEVYEHVLKIVLHMAHDDSDDQKITALPLLGDLAPIVGPEVCKNYLSSDLHALSQDNSFRVRKATVQYFGPICEQLGPDNTERQLLPIFKTLSEDNIWSVRKGCVESLVDVSKSISAESRGELIELMVKFLTDHSRWVRNTAYEQLGPFIATLSPQQISPEFLKYYTNIPSLSSSEADTDSSNHCAYNFPAVVLTLGPDRWPELVDTYNVLVRKTFKSRKTLSCSLHEIATILGTDATEQHLLGALDFFLKDIDDIREGIIKNFAAFLSVLSPPKREEHLATLWELVSEPDVNWRFRLYLAKQLHDIVYLYPAAMVSEQIVPLTFHLCDDRMFDVRTASVIPVAHLLKYLREEGSEAQYEDVVRKCESFHGARHHHKRQLFIRFCEACFELLPSDVFTAVCFARLLSYADDPVSNIRMRVAYFVKNNLFSHDEYKDTQEMNDAVVKFRADDNVEVRRHFCTELELQEFLFAQKQARPVFVQPSRILQQKTESDSESSLYESSSDSSSDDEDEPANILYQTGGGIKLPKANMPMPQSLDNEISNIPLSASTIVPHNPGTDPHMMDSRQGTPFRLPELDNDEDDTPDTNTTTTTTDVEAENPNDTNATTENVNISEDGVITTDIDNSNDMNNNNPMSSNNNMSEMDDNEIKSPESDIYLEQTDDIGVINNLNMSISKNGDEQIEMYDSQSLPTNDMEPHIEQEYGANKLEENPMQVEPVS